MGKIDEQAGFIVLFLINLMRLFLEKKVQGWGVDVKRLKGK